MRLKTLVFGLFILFLINPGVGQTGQTGAIKGRVTGPGEMPLAGVSVVITSPALVLKEMSTISSGNGVYRFPGLPPGEYRLTFSLKEMNPVIREDIAVRVGKTSSLDVTLTLKSLEEQVEVSRKATAVDRQHTAGLSSLTSEFLESIPTRSRTVMDYLNITPGINDNTANGSGEMENSYNLDGVNVGDPVTGTEYVTFAMDTMEEVAVQTGGLSAEYGSVKGAVLNIVTRSGSNRLHGSAYIYYDNENLQADNTEGTDLYDPQTPEKAGRKFQVEPGISLGGPITKNKLWFFGNLSMISREDYVPGYPHDKPPDQAVPVDRKEYFPYLKLTFRPSSTDKFMFSYTYSDLKSHHRDASRFYNEDTTRIQASPTHVWNVHWSKRVGDNIFANLKGAYIESEINFHSKKKGAQYYDWVTGFQTGTNWRNRDDSQRDRFQLNLDATAFLDGLAGSHDLKFGGELQYAKTRWILEVNPDPVTGLVWQFDWPEYIQGNGIYYGFHMKPFDRKDNMLNYAFFVNDTWNLFPGLTLNIGIRYDYNSTIWPAQNRDEFPIFNPFGILVDRRIPNTLTPVRWKNLSPRLGLIYDISQKGTLLFKASWATYVQPNTTQWVNMGHPNGWYYWIDVYNGYDFVQVSQSLTRPGGTAVGYKDYDLKAPTADELTLGIQGELWDSWSWGIRYIKKWDRNLLHVVDAASLDIDALMETGQLNWIDWQKVETVDPYSGNTVTFYNDLNPSRHQDRYIVNPPGAERNYDGFEFVLNKHYSRGWSLNGSYVYARARGLIGLNRENVDGAQSLGTSNLWVNPNAYINAEGRFPFERRHQVKVSGLFKGPWGIQIGGYFRHLSGRRWTRNITSNFLGLQLNQLTETIKAEKRGAHGYSPISLLDLRIQKTFKFGEIRLNLFADIFNLFNDNTVIEEFLDSSNPGTEFGQDLEIVDPRAIRLGAKIEF